MGSQVFPCGLQITILTPKVLAKGRSEFLLYDDFRCVLYYDRLCRYKECQPRWEGSKKKKGGGRKGIGIASFITRLPAISPASVIPHDLGGFSLRSKALWDKTVQIEFDSYPLFYSAINPVFAVGTNTSVLTLAVFLLYSFKTAALFILLHISLNQPVSFLFFIAETEIKGNLLLTPAECR